MQDGRHWKVACGVVGVLLLIQCASAILIYVSFPDWQTRGQFGDIFGVVNALFSGLAFAGLIYAILLQREDLTLQRAELKLTREELKRTAAAQEQSEIALRAQAQAARQSARLSATNFLIGRYGAEMEQLRDIRVPQGHPYSLRLQELEARREQLFLIIEDQYQELTKAEGA